MEDNGLYLIDNGYMLIIYVKKNVSINIFQNLQQCIMYIKTILKVILLGFVIIEDILI